MASISPINWNPIMAAQQQTIEGRNYLADKFSKLGQEITASVSLKNMEEEARSIAPRLGQEYRNAFGQIEGGDVSGGLSNIYNINASVARNPILARQSQEILKGAEMLAQDRMRTRLQQNQIGAANQRFAYGQEQQNLRQEQGFENQKELAQYKNELEQGEAQKPMTKNQQWQMIDKVYKRIDTVKKDLEENSDPETQKQSIRLLGTFLNQAAKVNPQLSQEENAEFLTDEDREELTNLSERLAKYESKTGTDSGIFGSGKEYKELVKETKAKINDLKKRSKTFYGARGVDTSAKIKYDDQEEMVDPFQEEVEEAGSPELPAQFQSPEDVKAAYKAGNLSKEQALNILQQNF